MADAHQCRRAPAWQDLAVAPASAAAAVALAATALLNRADFFLQDDARTYFHPMFREVSRLLLAGEPPFVTERSWYGGAILAEYQFGVLNPFSLALMALIGRMNDLAAAAAIFALAHIAILASGAFVLCRVLRCTRSVAFLAGLVAPTSEWIFYWGAGDWQPALTSISWGPWAWAGLLAAHRDHRWTPAGAAGVALVLLSGWPFADLALLISIVVVTALNLRSLFEQPRRLVAPVIAILCGGLLAAPAILPLAAYVQDAGRTVAPMLSADLAALIGVGTPFMVTRWTSFGGAQGVILMPMLQVTWFLVPALVAADWRTLWSRGASRSLVLLALVYAALSITQGFWQFRWMFRLLPYYQLALAVLAALALNEVVATRRPWRVTPTFIALAAPLWVAAWQDGRMTGFYLFVACALTLFASLALWFQPRRWVPFMATLALGHAALFVIVNTAYLGLGLYTGERPLPSKGNVSGEPALTRYMLFQYDRRPSTWTDFRPGGTSLERPGVTINGYSPLHHAPYEVGLCMDAFGAVTCDDAARRLTAPITGVGHSVLDLARVQEVRAQAGVHARTFAEGRPNWRQNALSEGNLAFRRPEPFKLPAPVSAAPPNAGVADVRASPDRVSFDYDGREGGRVILARAWYPGWRASLDGKPLTVNAVAGLFVAADVPPNSHGRLVFTYWPAGLTLGLAAAAMGLVLLTAATGILALRSRTAPLDRA